MLRVPELLRRPLKLLKRSALPVSVTDIQQEQEPDMASMMAGLLTEGEASTGFGVRFYGFHTSSQDFPKKLSELIHTDRTPHRFLQCEVNGYLTCLAMQQERSIDTKLPLQFGIFRREPHKFFQDLGEFLHRIAAVHVIDFSLTSSLGSLTLTILYQRGERTV